MTAQSFDKHRQFKVARDNVGLKSFFKALYAPILEAGDDQKYFVEICDKPVQESYMRTKTFRIRRENFEKICGHVYVRNQDGCVFYTVCPRDRGIINKNTERYIRAARSDVSVATACWLDIDFKLLDQNLQAAEAKADEIIANLNPFPSIIISTPGGYHLYFLLDTAYPVEDVVQTNRRLEAYTGADSCGDAMRLMRIPVGFHLKNPNSPKHVKIVHFDSDLRYTLSDFEHFPQVQQSSRMDFAPVVFSDTPVSKSVAQILKRLQKFDKNLANKINAPDLDTYRSFVKDSKVRSRSERDFHICARLDEGGVSAEEIRKIFQESSCGDRYREKGKDGDRYLRHQIEAARQQNLANRSQQLRGVRIISPDAGDFDDF
ncbi:hypothetical protein [Saccharibacillus sacchari]|uniref:hypothetical protein n=1 Tax=Saccharibacillus sacchari TaxID=456493 RepID=UPI0004AFB8EE|nr:hypothetical protein [Saccharibacillus sacchari]